MKTPAEEDFFLLRKSSKFFRQTEDKLGKCRKLYEKELRIYFFREMKSGDEQEFVK